MFLGIMFLLYFMKLSGTQGFRKTKIPYVLASMFVCTCCIPKYCHGEANKERSIGVQNVFVILALQRICLVEPLTCGFIID